MDTTYQLGVSNQEATSGSLIFYAACRNGNHALKILRALILTMTRKKPQDPLFFHKTFQLGFLVVLRKLGTTMH